MIPWLQFTTANSNRNIGYKGITDTSTRHDGRCSHCKPNLTVNGLATLTTV